jgi:hypothetical protein
MAADERRSKKSNSKGLGWYRCDQLRGVLLFSFIFFICVLICGHLRKNLF